MDDMPRQEVPAAFGRRFVAFALDIALVRGVAYVLPRVNTEQEVVLAFVYFWLLTAFLGRTPGKMVLGIHVLSARGRMTLGTAFLREVLGKMIAFGTFFLGVLWIAIDPQKRGWHDLLAGSRAVRVLGVAPSAAGDAAVAAAPAGPPPIRPARVRIRAPWLAGWRMTVRQITLPVLAIASLVFLAGVVGIELEALSRRSSLPPFLSTARVPVRFLTAVSLSLLALVAAVQARRLAPAPMVEELVVEAQSFSSTAKVFTLWVGALMILAGGLAFVGVVMSGWELLAFVPMAGAFTVALLGGGLIAVVQIRSSIQGRPSHRLRAPQPWTFLLALVLVVAAGEVTLRARGEPDLSFAMLLLLGAALPPMAAVAVAAAAVGVPPSVRRMSMAAVTGGTLSVVAAIILEVLVPGLAALFIAPVRDLFVELVALVDEGKFSDLLRSPVALLVLSQLAVVAPVVEEAVKPLGVVILGRRIRHARDALLLGMACGAGFAIIENITYEGGGLNLWTGITVVRAVGGALHPFGAGLVSLGLFGVFHQEPGAWRHLARNYLLAVGAHAVWNGASGIFMLLESAHRGVLGPVDLQGVVIDVALLALLLGEGVVLMLGIREIARRLAAGQPSLPTPAPARALALWGIACMGVLLPVAVAGGSAVLRYLGSALIR